MAIITISRGTCSGGKELAECIAGQLGYKCVSREIIVEASQKYGVSAEALASSLDKAPRFFQRLKRERDRYLAIIRAALCEYALDNNLVYHGNAGHFLIAGPKHVIRVRVIADMPFRIDAAMRRLGLTRDKAIKYINQVDKERIRWTKFLYGVEWQNPQHYDAVLNLERISIPGACAIVCRLVELDDFRWTEESQQALVNLTLSSRVQAALLSDERTAANTFEVFANKGEVTIRGSVKLQEAANAISEVAGAVDGVAKVNCEIGLSAGILA